MQGDYSRWTFDARKDYRSVLLQQGRVLLDADWNEQTELTRYHDETRTRDIVGRAGGPADSAGFEIVDAAGHSPANTAWADLRITPGRYYVDGILAEAWPLNGTAGPGTALTDQPYLAAIGTDPGLPEPADDGRYALYLDVWTHNVTADEDPSVRESALGGPDTTTRARTVWQVRSVPIAADQQCSDLHAPGWLAVSPGTITPSLKEAAPDADPCLISTSGGYTRLENQLYRVQIHDTGGGAARYLWSRENGSVVAGLVDIGTPAAPGLPTPLIVDRVGRDDDLSIREGDTVEVTSTDWQLRGQPGFLAIAGAPDGLVLPVNWSGTAPTALGVLGVLGELGKVPIVRRWEGPPRPAATTSDDLEDGIAVSFDGGPFSSGDYWLIPARTVRLAYGLTALSGTLDWPSDAAGQPVSAPPLGPVHHITPLAIVTKDATGWTRVSDCRRFVPSLNQMTAIDLIGGDGQEAPPNEPLPEQVRVAVRNGGLPVPGAVVHFSAKGGSITDGTTSGGDINTVTAANGIAGVVWTLDKNGTTTQTLAAQRLDDHGSSVDVEVVVTGRLSQPGGRTLGLQVTQAVFNNGPAFVNDSTIKPVDLASGITVTLNGPPDPRSITNKPVVRVVLDLPWPLPWEVIGSAPGTPPPPWQTLKPVGFSPIELDATVSGDADKHLITWNPSDTARQWLLEQLRLGLQANWQRPLVGRFMIDGWAVVGRDDPNLHLNGHARTTINANGQTQRSLPTDDEVTGGQFIQWFQLEWRLVP